MQAQVKNAASSGLPILHSFLIAEGSEQVEVQPLWLLVHQQEPDGAAK